MPSYNDLDQDYPINLPTRIREEPERERIVRVMRINGTSDNVCKCGSWLAHWKNHSGQALPLYCPEDSCLQKPEVGAHVQMDDSADSSWYIVPLCKAHNGEIGKSLEISCSVELVSANVKRTCGK